MASGTLTCPLRERVLSKSTSASATPRVSNSSGFQLFGFPTPRVFNPSGFQPFGFLIHRVFARFASNGGLLRENLSLLPPSVYASRLFVITNPVFFRRMNEVKNRYNAPFSPSRRSASARRRLVLRARAQLWRRASLLARQNPSQNQTRQEENENASRQRTRRQDRRAKKCFFSSVFFDEKFRSSHRSSQRPLAYARCKKYNGCVAMTTLAFAFLPVPSCCPLFARPS